MKLQCWAPEPEPTAWQRHPPLFGALDVAVDLVALKPTGIDSSNRINVRGIEQLLTPRLTSSVPGGDEACRSMTRAFAIS